MNAVETILKDVEDSQRLHTQGDLAVPLLGLMEAYNEVAKRRGIPNQLNPRSIGLELKQSLGSLKMKDKIALLHLYKENLKVVHQANSTTAFYVNQGVPVPPPAETPLSQAERLRLMEEEGKIKFRAKARMVGLFVIAPIPPLLAGAMVAIAVNKGSFDNAFASGLMSTAVAILKVLFSV